jgi:hypothetical protein
MGRDEPRLVFRGRSFGGSVLSSVLLSGHPAIWMLLDQFASLPLSMKQDN